MDFVVEVGLCGSGRVHRGVVMLVASVGQDGHYRFQHLPDVTLSGNANTAAWLEIKKSLAPADDCHTHAFDKALW